MDNDDLPVGRILNRREVLALLGAAGVALLAGCSIGADDEPPATATTQVGTTGATATPPSAAATATTSATQTPAAAAPATESSTGAVTTAATDATAPLPACIVSPALTEGPYYVDDDALNRSDIRSDPASGVVSEGTPLELVLRAWQVGSGGCSALAGAVVDVWHCDALGVYSGVSDPGFDTLEQRFLRGYQVTDADGTARFTTIYPGWYPGRAVHIHFKVRGDAGSGQSFEFTSQLFFDEAVTDQVHAQEPYAGKGYRTLLNAGDGIYQQSGGQLTLATTATDAGYTATFDIGVQLS
jgi:protocatechuate 3,4-dioxygenase beta subunit